MVNFKMPEDVYEAVMAMRSPVPYRVLMYRWPMPMMHHRPGVKWRRL